jgi:hypothetical protein
MPSVVVRAVFKGIDRSQHSLPEVVFNVRIPVDDTRDRLE